MRYNYVNYAFVHVNIHVYMYIGFIYVTSPYYADQFQGHPSHTPSYPTHVDRPQAVAGHRPLLSTSLQPTQLIWHVRPGGTCMVEGKLIVCMNVQIDVE